MNFSDYNRRTPDQQLADLNAAWDRIKKLSGTNDRQQVEIEDLKDKLRAAKLKLWIASAALVALWEVVKFLAELALHIH
ncbi:MAG TPA: hypothetical protein VGG46_04115 [Terriglobales bacterium]|jgi:hypothetical protein